MNPSGVPASTAFVFTGGGSLGAIQVGAQLIASARLSTRAWIDGGGLTSTAFPGQLLEHQHAA